MASRTAQLEGEKSREALHAPLGLADILVIAAGSDAAITVSMPTEVQAAGVSDDTLAQVRPSALAPLQDIVGTPADDVLIGTNGRDDIRGRGGGDTIIGASGNDLLFGNAGDDAILGGLRSDRLFGNLGDDVLEGGAGKDRIAGGVGTDTLSGDAGRDRLSGGAAGDQLGGGAGRDVLRGGGGADRLDGGQDADVLTGGAGVDRFLITGLDGEVDRITDCDLSTELIDVSAASGRGGPPPRQFRPPDAHG